ncbi:MAG TPA: hypothetical protein VGS10_02155 [Terracidiphilus sp.]|nr:hypothetical protein [Terracidiphilus sp.]
MEATSTSGTVRQPGRSLSQILKSYFYWTYPRGSFHYDVMVTLILLFIFITPFFWKYGARPSRPGGPQYPIQVVGNDGHGMILTVSAADVHIPQNASIRAVKLALRNAVEPVTGDAVFVERWETVTDSRGRLAWKIWVHR